MQHINANPVPFSKALSHGLGSPLIYPHLLFGVIYSGAAVMGYLFKLIPEWLLYALLVPIWYFPLRKAYRFGKCYHEGRDSAKRELLQLWANAGKTEAERAERHEELSRSRSLDATLLAAGLGAAVTAPLVNIDGTPMVDFASVDIKGNPYGVIDMFSNDSFDFSSGFGSSGFDDDSLRHGSDDGLHGGGMGGGMGGGFGSDPFD